MTEMDQEHDTQMSPAEKAELLALLSSKEVVGSPVLYAALAKCAMGALMSPLFWPVKVEGKENLPTKGPYVLVANHDLYRDPCMFGHEIEQPIHFISKIELYENPAMRWLLQRIYTIPVDRESLRSGAVAMMDASKVLESGGVVGVFPYGTRDSKVKEGAKPEEGAGYLAVRNNVPLLPGAIERSGRLTVVRFGEPIYPKPGLSKQERKVEAVRINDLANESVLRLLGRTSICDIR